MTELARGLSSAINREARLHYSSLAEKTGVNNFATTNLTRLALRLSTPYPYRLTHDDTFFPKGDDATFGRVIEASRQEGFDEIHETIAEQPNEHAWLFIPGISAWIDITQRASVAEAQTDQYIETFASYLFDDIEDIHTHPDQTVRTLSQEEPWHYSHNYLLEASRLSTGDIIRHAQMAARSAHGTQLRSSVVSHHGVTTLSLRNPASKSASFTHGANIDTRILEASLDPIIDIKTNLSRIAANLVTVDTGEPVFVLQFQPLHS